MTEYISYDEFKNFIMEYVPRCSNEKNEIQISHVLLIFQGKWNNHVLFQLCRHEKVRFGGLKKAMPDITSTMLASTLRELESYGLINRIQFNEIPPHVEYSLTEKGKDLLPIFYEMYKWGLKHSNE